MAPSTLATIAPGVETATSIPHAWVNSHSLRISLILATTRGTPNSDLASKPTTRLALSSPVAAMSTSHVSAPASSSVATSQASANSQSASGTTCGSNLRRSRSISSTLWPLSSSSCATERPTLPAPAIPMRVLRSATRPSSSIGGRAGAMAARTPSRRDPEILAAPCGTEALEPARAVPGLADRRLRAARQHRRHASRDQGGLSQPAAVPPRRRRHRRGRPRSAVRRRRARPQHRHRRAGRDPRRGRSHDPLCRHPQGAGAPRVPWRPSAWSSAW